MPKIIDWKEIKNYWQETGEQSLSISAQFGVSKRSVDERLVLWKNEQNTSPQITSLLKAQVAKNRNDRLTEAAICYLIKQEIDRIIRRLNLPSVQDIRPQFTLGNGSRADFVLFHKDGSVSIFEVKAGFSRHELFQAIGQVLYYSEVFAETYNIPSDSINLAILSSYEADEYLLKSLSRVDRPILYLKVDLKLEIGK